jgi:hypothetical protein
VTGAYTQAAWEKGILPVLRHAPEAVPDIQPLLAAFVEEYRSQFFDQWRRFLTDFPRGELAWVDTHTHRRQLAARLLEVSAPYDRILNVAVENMQPLLPPPAAALPPQTATQAAEPFAWARVLQHYAESASRKTYLDALREAGKQLAGESAGEASFQLARAGLQEGKPTEKATHPLLKAWWAVDQFREQQDTGGAAAAAVLWPLLQRPLLFVWRVLLEETGIYLQERWNELLLEVKDLSIGQKHEVLYGKGGKLAAFVSGNGPAASFLERRGEEYIRKRLADTEVAFTDPFLLYLKRARVGWAQPEFDDAKRRISVSVTPAVLQAEGDVKVARTELILDCDAGRQVLGTPNTGGEYPFVWTVKSCFHTTVRVYLADTAGQELASLARRYPGFLQFLEHFSSARRVFSVSDFTVENAAQPVPYRIQAITLRHSFSPADARQQLLKDLEMYKRYEENVQARLDLPDKIVATLH